MSQSNSSPPSAAAQQPSSLVNWSLLEDPTLLHQCRNALSNDGAMTIPNFATSKGLTQLKAEVLSCPYNDSQQNYTPWQDQGDTNYPSDHPRNYRMDSSAAFVGRKSLEQTPRRLGISLYDDGRMISFLSAVANKKLYRSTDDNGSVYSYRIQSNHKPPWHFDESPYTAIIYLQDSEGGGEFEFVPWCRPTQSKDDTRGHEIVRHILMENNTDDVRQIAAQPGTLIFFSGSHSFHRAGPVTGSTARLGLVFTFGEDEGFANSDDVKGANEWDPRDSSCLIKAEGDHKEEDAS